MDNNPFPRWIKKYMPIKHLYSTLNERRMHLSKPECWQDKNDGKLLSIYSDAFSMHETRCTCFTLAADRFHFWAIFGKREKGVCLWFDKDKLLRDIGEDNNLIAQCVQYKTPKQLRSIEPDKLPFTKRKQYVDEKEFRIIKNYLSVGPENDGFYFSAPSLERIYLNPWLGGKALMQKKTCISSMLRNNYEHVTIYQNRTLRQRAWIDAARVAAKSA